MPSRPFIGVRSSWLVTAMKVDLARAASRAFSRSSRRPRVRASIRLAAARLRRATFSVAPISRTSAQRADWLAASSPGMKKKGKTIRHPTGTMPLMISNARGW